MAPIHHIFLALVVFLPSILCAPIPTPQGSIIGVPCFGNAALGCSLKGGKRAIEVITRTPEPEPQGSIIGMPCFGNSALGCRLTEGKREAEPEKARTDPRTGASTTRLDHWNVLL